MKALTVVLALGSIVLSCGGPTANDGQVTQVMQEARSDLKADPGDRSPRFLNLTKAAELASRNTTEPDDRAPGELDSLLREPSRAGEETSNDEVNAIAIAQDGLLAIAAGQAEKGEKLLESSMALYPNLDALGGLASRYAKAGHSALLVDACQQTLDTVEPDKRYDVLLVCRKARHEESVDTALGWASPDDRRFFTDEAARRKKP